MPQREFRQVTLIADLHLDRATPLRPRALPTELKVRWEAVYVTYSDDELFSETELSDIGDGRGIRYGSRGRALKEESARSIKTAKTNRGNRCQTS
jgi:hypothetical protein